jgi:hypothetical protein
MRGRAGNAARRLLTSASRVRAFSDFRVVADVTLLNLDAFVRIALVDILAPTLARVIAGNLEAQKKKCATITQSATSDGTQDSTRGALQMCVALT